MIDTINILGILGISQVIVSVALMVFSVPCLFGAPEEPFPKIVQWSYDPSDKRPIPDTYISKAFLHKSWYVKSISEYSGARGTMTNRIFLLTTTLSAVFQSFIALLLFCYNDTRTEQQADHNIVRLILMLLGALGSLVLGQVESTLLWKYAREEEPFQLWRRLSGPEKLSMYKKTLQEFGGRYLPTLKKDAETGLFRVDETIGDQKDEEHDDDVSLLDDGYFDTRFTTVMSKWYLSDGLSDLEIKFIGDCVNETDKKGFRYLENLYEAPYEWYLCRLFIMEQEELFLQHRMYDNTARLDVDNTPKTACGIAHTTFALLLVFCNSIGVIIGNSKTIERYVSSIFAIVGFSFFIIFCLLQFLSGNYDLESQSRCLEPLLNCIKRLSINMGCRCPQDDPYEDDQTRVRAYYGRDRRCIGFAFMTVEMVGFGAIALSLAVESIVLAYQ